MLWAVCLVRLQGTKEDNKGEEEEEEKEEEEKNKKRRRRRKKRGKRRRRRKVSAGPWGCDSPSSRSFPNRSVR